MWFDSARPSVILSQLPFTNKNRRYTLPVRLASQGRPLSRRQRTANGRWQLVLPHSTVFCGGVFLAACLGRSCLMHRHCRIVLWRAFRLGGNKAFVNSKRDL